MAKTTHTQTSWCVETLLQTKAVPESVKTVFRKSVGQLRTNEQVMWREVAARLTLDAHGVTPEVTNVRDGMTRDRFIMFKRAVNEARRWFRSPRTAADAEEVFEFWGGDIGPVRTSVAALPPVLEPQLKAA